MRGSIRRRGPNSWQVRVFLGRGPDGKRKYSSQTVRGTKRDAQKKLAAIVTSVHSGTFIEPQRISLAEYLRTWLGSYARNHVAASTFDRYQHIIEKNLIPGLGAIQLSKLSPSAIKAYYAEMLKSGGASGKPLSGTTVLQHHRILREALQHALQENLLAINPADRIPAPKKLRRQMTPLDGQQAATLLEAVMGHRLEVPVVLAVHTGLRRGEVLGLRWQDVDLTRGVLTVQQTLEQTNGGMRFKEPKTHRSSRRIDLLPITVEVLKRHRAEQAKLKLALGSTWQESDLVCSSADGSPWKPDTMSSAFSKFVSQLEIPAVRFHDLRHTHATLLLREGVHPKIVSERLGHSGIGLTMDTYSHVLPGMQQEAAMKLNASLSEQLDRLHNDRDGQKMAKTGSDDILPVTPSKSRNS